MATINALLMCLAAYTGTVVLANYLGGPQGGTIPQPLNFDIYSAALKLSETYGLAWGVPEPFHWGVGIFLLILPSLIVFWLFRNIFR